MAGKIFRGEYPFRLPVHLKAPGQVTVEVPGKIGVYDGAYDEAYDEAYEPLNDIEQKILGLCSVQARNTHDLLQFLGYKTRTGNFKKALARVLDAGYLAMTIPDKPRSKKQRYRLTKKGLRWLGEFGGTP